MKTRRTIPNSSPTRGATPDSKVVHANAAAFIGIPEVSQLQHTVVAHPFALIGISITRINRTGNADAIWQAANWSTASEDPQEFSDRSA